MDTKVFFLLAVAVVAPLRGAAQDGVSRVLASVEARNTTLRTLAQQAEADRLSHRTGIFPADPHLEFGHFWGPSGGGEGRHSASVSQGLDLPALLGMRHRQAGMRSAMLGARYRADRSRILLEAKLYCIELIYCNRMRQELAVRLQHAHTLAAGYESRLQRGDASRLEYRRVHLNLLAVQGEAARLDEERAALRAELARLNGGEAVVLEDTQYPECDLPPDFESWFADAARRHPELQYAGMEVAAQRQQVSLARAQWIPSLSVRYMLERMPEQLQQGVSVSLSIPLWANANRVGQTRAALAAAEIREADAHTQLHGQLRALHGRAMAFRMLAAEHRQELEHGGSDLLKRALEAGEISLLEYIVESGLYYDTMNRVLAFERDFQLAYARLTALEL